MNPMTRRKCELQCKVFGIERGRGQLAASAKLLIYILQFHTSYCDLTPSFDFASFSSYEVSSPFSFLRTIVGSRDVRSLTSSIH